METQHGLMVERARQIYSFSHLTFQEYFTARAIVASSEVSLQQLVRHLTEQRWREVFLLTAQMLPNADRLLQLMKQQVDALVSAKPTFDSDRESLVVLEELAIASLPASESLPLQSSGPAVNFTLGIIAAVAS